MYRAVLHDILGEKKQLRIVVVVPHGYISCFKLMGLWYICHDVSPVNRNNGHPRPAKIVLQQPDCAMINSNKKYGDLLFDSQSSMIYLIIPYQYGDVA